MAHLPGVLGLVINIIGSILLLFGAPTVMTATMDGAVVPAPYKTLHPTVQKLYRPKRNVFFCGIAGLIIGFVLQLLDLLCA
jgi:hypothetical protein